LEGGEYPEGSEGLKGAGEGLEDFREETVKKYPNGGDVVDYQEHAEAPQNSQPSRVELGRDTSEGNQETPELAEARRQREGGPMHAYRKHLEGSYPEEKREQSRVPEGPEPDNKPQLEQSQNISEGPSNIEETMPPTEPSVTSQRPPQEPELSSREDAKPEVVPGDNSVKPSENPIEVEPKFAQASEARLEPSRGGAPLNPELELVANCSPTLQISTFETPPMVANSGQNHSTESDVKLVSSREDDGDSSAMSKPFDNQFQDTDRAPGQAAEGGREIEYELHGTILTGIDSAKVQDSRPPESHEEHKGEIEILKASAYGHTSALLVPDRMIPAHDQRSDVFEVKVSRGSEPDKEFSLYATHRPGYDRAYLNLYQLDPERGEEFRIRPPTRFTPSNFAEEYNGAKPFGLENTALFERGGEFWLKAGETELPFFESKLRVYQGRVVLDGNVEGIGEVKISKALDTFDFRLKDHSCVTSIKESLQGVVLSYQRTGHDPYPHRRVVSEVEAESFPAHKHEAPLVPGRIEVTSRGIEGRALRFDLKADEATVECVMNALDSARNVDEFRKLKGDIAEELVKKVGPSIGLIVRADHPFNNDPLKTSSERTGPDLLASLGEHGDLSYVEVKWWAIKANATKEATSQVKRYLSKHPTWNGLPVRGGYIAIVDWRPESEEFSLKLERVDGEEVGANGFNR
jgi:hypothetical protein